MLAPDTRVLVLGARGMLGRALCAALAGRCRLTGWDLEELDITARDSVLEAICGLAPDEVINCAAFTNVDACEDSEETAAAVNGVGAGHVAEACAGAGARMVQISTEYVFDGEAEAGYAEDGEPNPVNAYGRGKLAGERAVAASGCRHAVVRTQWLYGRGGRNFVDSIVRRAGERNETEIKVVDDQFGRPTWTDELAAALVGFLEHESGGEGGGGGEGIYHLAAGGVCSWYEAALEIVEAAGLGARVKPVPTSAFPRPARRPAHAVLRCGRAEREFGIVLRDWRPALRDYLGEAGTREVSSEA